MTLEKNVPSADSDVLLILLDWRLSRWLQIIVFNDIQSQSSRDNQRLNLNEVRERQS